MPIDRFPHYTQLDSMDCGPTCLRMIAKYYGRRYSLETLRDKAFITREGVSMLGISDAAESIGFRTSGVRITLRQLKEDVPLPCILHWNQNHFVVCYKIKDDRYYIADPAAGKVVYREAEFTPCWYSTKVNGEETGTALLLEPGPEFYEQGVADYLKHYRDLHAMCPAPFGGIPELLRELRRKHVITALVTGKGRRSCDISLAYYGFAELFDVVETGSPSGPDKPEGIRRVLKQFRLKEEEAVYVGDAPSDIQSARTAGIPVISAAWAPSAEPEVLLSLKPDRIFYSVADFRSYLDSLTHGMK